MVKISSSTRRGTAPAEEDNARVGEHERADARRSADRAAADRATAERAADSAETERIAAERGRVGRPGDRTDEATRTEDIEHERELALERAAVATGPKPRASLLATFGLIFGVAAALFVLTGALAGYGVGLGVVALLLSIAGLSATSRRHVAGKTDALIGLVLGLGALLVGIMALTGASSWLTTDTNTVERFQEWLDSQFANRF